MTAPVAILQIASDGTLRFAVSGAAPVRFIVIDEGCPGDRVFEVTARASEAELAALVPPGAPIGSDADPRHAALVGLIEAAATGRRHLRSVG